jgi:hypothetical protein
MQRLSTYVVMLILGSVLVAAYHVVVYVQQGSELTMLARLWPSLFPFIVVLWASEDSKRHPGIYRPFDWGFLVLVFWIAYMPYYLWKSRGKWGIALALGLVLLAVLSDVAVLIASELVYR